MPYHIELVVLVPIVDRLPPGTLVDDPRDAQAVLELLDRGSTLVPGLSS